MKNSRNLTVRFISSNERRLREIADSLTSGILNANSIPVIYPALGGSGEAYAEGYELITRPAGSFKKAVSIIEDRIKNSEDVVFSTISSASGDLITVIDTNTIKPKALELAS